MVTVTRVPLGPTPYFVYISTHFLLHKFYTSLLTLETPTMPNCTAALHPWNQKSAILHSCSCSVLTNKEWCYRRSFVTRASHPMTKRIRTLFGLIMWALILTKYIYKIGSVIHKGGSLTESIEWIRSWKLGRTRRKRHRKRYPRLQLTKIS